jgi:hypothetical protein
MAPSRKQIAPELVAEGRRLYEQTLTPVPDIAAMMGISRTTFNDRAREWGWTKRHAHDGAVDLARAVRGAAVAALTSNAVTVCEAQPADAARSEALPPARRVAVAARIQSVVEREMDAVERVLDKLGPADQAEAERTARTLASLARTLREIAALTRPDEVMPPDDADDDPIPRDIDEFRRELARRIHAIIDARRSGEGGRGDEAAAGAEVQRG